MQEQHESAQASLRAELESAQATLKAELESQHESAQASLQSQLERTRDELSSVQATAASSGADGNSADHQSEKLLRDLRVGVVVSPILGCTHIP